MTNAEVSTPVPDDPFALSPWLRVLAAGADTIAIGTMAAVFMVVVLLGSRLTGILNSAVAATVPTIAGASGLIAAVVALAGMESSSWQTSPGKAIFRIKLVDARGRRFSFRRSLFRNAVKWISYPIWIVYLFFCFPNFNNLLKPAPKMITLHDVLSSTRAIKARNVQLLQDVGSESR